MGVALSLQLAVRLHVAQDLVRSVLVAREIVAYAGQTNDRGLRGDGGGPFEALGDGGVQRVEGAEDNSHVGGKREGGRAGIGKDTVVMKQRGARRGTHDALRAEVARVRSGIPVAVPGGVEEIRRVGKSIGFRQHWLPPASSAGHDMLCSRRAAVVKAGKFRPTRLLDQGENRAEAVLRQGIGDGGGAAAVTGGAKRRAGGQQIIVGPLYGGRGQTGERKRSVAVERRSTEPARQVVVKFELDGGEACLHHVVDEAGAVSKMRVVERSSA